jgi:hypothetical protein
MWNDLLLPEDNTFPAIAYGARGAGLWQQTVEEPDAALTAAVGAGRARVLQQLDTPRNTGELAERLGMTAGNISIHIARLREVTVSSCPSLTPSLTVLGAIWNQTSSVEIASMSISTWPTIPFVSTQTSGPARSRRRRIA